MNTHNWKVFNKAGHNLNWVPQPFINLEFVTTAPVPMPATGYIVTDVSGYPKECVITNEGYLYDGENVTLNYNYGLNINSSSGTYPIGEGNYEITYKDVSIFNPLPKNTKAIESVEFLSGESGESYNYGILYNWYVASNAGITSNDVWRVPTSADSSALYLYTGSDENQFIRAICSSDFITEKGLIELMQKISEVQGAPLPPEYEEQLPQIVEAIRNQLTDPLNLSIKSGGYRFYNMFDMMMIALGQGQEPDIYDLFSFSGMGYLTSLWINSYIETESPEEIFPGSGIYETIQPLTLMLMFMIEGFMASPNAASVRWAGNYIRLVRDATAEELSYPDGTLCEDYIGNNGIHYPTVKIDNLVWLKESLSETELRDGTPIGIEEDSTNWINRSRNEEPLMCYFNNLSSYAYTNLTSLPQFLYPSTTYAAALFLKPISVGLIETEHLFLLENLNDINIRPYDSENPYLLLQFVGDDNEIQFFNVDENSSEIVWSNELIIDTSIYEENAPIQINIGFKSDFEGIFERTLQIYHLVGETLFLLAEIIVNAEAIGEDERYKTLLSNFGLPQPNEMKDIFKETDINEDLPDWKILNYKAKHMILEHDKIMPYVGTYKGLINSVKWLGYDDIYFREWFLNVKENKKLSFIVPFEAKDRTQTILMFNADQRKSFKKLNQLSLNYCITRETGQIDDWGNPITENCYSYNLKEVFIKLLGLKNWLEKNIIGVNARITDITGEGIYFDRIHNLVYETDTIGYEYKIDQTLSPFCYNDKTELIYGDASLYLSFSELEKTKISDMSYSFKDAIFNVWHKDNPSTFYDVNDASFIQNPSDYLLIGPNFKFPFIHIKDISWKTSILKDYSGVIPNSLVTKPLFVLENDLRFYDILESSSYFHCASTNLTILLEQAYLRDPSINEWENSIAYEIYKDSSLDHDYILKDPGGNLYYFDGYVTFTKTSTSYLKYEVDRNYKVPLLSMNNFKTVDSYNNQIDINKEYILDIIDGKIYMDAKNPEDNNENVTYYLNWHYDSSSNYTDTTINVGEQNINLGIIYESNRMPLYQMDVSIYYWADPSLHSGTEDSSVYLIDNSIYTMNVNHTGDYELELFAWNDYNVAIHNKSNDKVNVYIKHPTIYSISSDFVWRNDISINSTDISTLLEKEKTPLYDRIIPLQGLKVEYDNENKPYVLIPSITYFQDLPEPKSINRVYNLTERIISVSDNIIQVDEDYMKFYENDNVNIVAFNEEKYNLKAEVSANIISCNNSSPNEIILDISINHLIDSSTKLYILNDTLRQVSVIDNSINLIYVNDYQFLENQNVGIIVKDKVTNYEYGATYRVISSSDNYHTLDYALPNFIIDTSRFDLFAKHAFSTYSTMYSTVNKSSEININGNYFKIYLNDSNCQEHYIDNTFIYVNLLFDYDKAYQNWYKNDDTSKIKTYYYHNKPIELKQGNLALFSAKYTEENNFVNYLDTHKNIWEVIEHDTSTLQFKVFNDNVSYVFNEMGTYDIKCTSYDKYGNSIITIYEGLIKVIENKRRYYTIQTSYSNEYESENTNQTQLTE